MIAHRVTKTPNRWHPDQTDADLEFYLRYSTYPTIILDRVTRSKWITSLILLPYYYLVNHRLIGYVQYRKDNNVTVSRHHKRSIDNNKLFVATLSFYTSLSNLQNDESWVQGKKISCEFSRHPKRKLFSCIDHRRSIDNKKLLSKLFVHLALKSGERRMLSSEVNILRILASSQTQTL